MSSLIRCYPGDRGLDFLLVVTLGVALASSAAWLISRRLAGKAALRHLVLFSALICCLASPAVAWFCAAAGLTLVSIPILRGEQGRMASGVTQIETDPVGMPPRRSTDPPPVAGGLPLPHTNTTIDQSADVAVAPAANQSPATSTPSAPDVQRAGGLAGTLVSFRGIATGAMFVWAAGALLMLARLARNCGRVVQLRRTSRPVQNECLQSLLQEIAARLGTRQVPLLLVSNRTVTPLAVGFGRPAVILPERLLGAVSDKEVRDVLVHEVAHLQRGDQRIVLLQELAGALYWPIVSVHGLNRELQRAREEVCDNVVLAGRDAISYGKTLLHVAELLVKARPMGAAVGIIGGQGELERRIAGLIDPRRNTMTTTGRKAACVVMFMFIAGGAIASATRFAASASAAGTSTGTVADVASPDPEASSTPPDIAAQAAPPIQKPLTARDPDDPKFAAHFSGRVTGADGKPVSRARVFIAPLSDGLNGELAVRAETGALAVRAETGADGRFEFDASDMTLTDLDGLPTRRRCILIATCGGYGPDWIETRGRTRSSFVWDPVKGTDLALQLATDDVPIHGRFLDPDGRPLAGARVRLNGLMIPQQRDLDAYLDREKKYSIFAAGMNYERSLYRPPVLPGLTTETRTDADGRFTLSGLGRDRLAKLTVSAPSVVDTDLTVMTRDAPDVRVRLGDNDLLPPEYPPQVIHGAGFTLQLKRGRTISGVVRDRDSREPIPGMWVGPRRESPLNGLLSGEYSRATDAKGRFTITGLSPLIVKQDVMAVAAPGLPYQTATVELEGDSEVLIECPRGIPYRLKLVDEQGRPVEAEVTYVDVEPNPHAESVRFSMVPQVYDARWPISRAAKKADGTYEGFVLPGPGAVLVKTPGRLYRPAHVDPKAFFAPGRTNWTAQERITAYGTQDTLSTFGGWGIDQHDYTAIVLINPALDSGPLELSATVVRDTPRRVSLIDADGKPVMGVETQGMTFHPYDTEPPLRAASFSLTGLHPDRVRRITFRKDDRQLIGFLLARGNGDTPYTVRMQPWGTVTGRIVDENGKPSTATLSLGDDPRQTNADPDVGVLPDLNTDAEGRFRIDRLVPGQRYSAKIYRGVGLFAGMAFENLVVRPGEVRDLGDIRTKPSVDAESGTKPGN